MNALVIAAHPGDEAVGCGGSLTLHVARGDRVCAVFLTAGELGLKGVPADEARRIRRDEAINATATLGVTRTQFLGMPDGGVERRIASGADLLEPILRAEEPAVIYIPQPSESHPDRRAVLPITWRALRQARLLRAELRVYEFWSPLIKYDLVEDVSTVMPLKLGAIGAYQSHLWQYRYDRAVTGLNRYRGALAGKCEFAEVFALLDPREPAGRGAEHGPHTADQPATSRAHPEPTIPGKSA